MSTMRVQRLLTLFRLGASFSRDCHSDRFKFDRMKDVCKSSGKIQAVAASRCHDAEANSALYLFCRGSRFLRDVTHYCASQPIASSSKDNLVASYPHLQFIYHHATQCAPLHSWSASLSLSTNAQRGTRNLFALPAGDFPSSFRPALRA